MYGRFTMVYSIYVYTHIYISIYVHTCRTDGLVLFTVFLLLLLLLLVFRFLRFVYCMYLKIYNLWFYVPYAFKLIAPHTYMRQIQFMGSEVKLSRAIFYCPFAAPLTPHLHPIVIVFIYFFLLKLSTVPCVFPV